MTAAVLSLRTLGIDDWKAIHAFASHPESCRYQPWGPNTEEETRQFVQAAVQAWARVPQSRFVYAACVNETVVGLGELNIRSLEHRQGEISYLLHPGHWGRGLGTAIGRELLTVGFGRLELHRIYATCDPRNTRSRRVLTRLGMIYEGCHRHTKLLRDGWRDSEFFSLLDTEWNRPGPTCAPSTAC